MWLILCLSVDAEPLRYAHVFHDDKPHGELQSQDPSVHVVSWPFCPSTGSCQSMAWVEVGVALDAYVARRNGPHAAASELIATSRQDVAPIARALTQLFIDKGIESDAVKVSYVQGLVQSVEYRLDSETGWTEYPKYALETIFDEQGDCDDAAIMSAALLLELGYEPYLVRWRMADDSAGHLSTALALGTGDLAQVKRPAGSPLVVDSHGNKYLHVDGTGSKQGCTRGCVDLGWNGWPAKGMELRAVVSALDPELDTILPLRAWDNDNALFPSRQKSDRRGEDPSLDRLEDWDWEERTLRRLERLGQKDPELWLKKRRPDPVGDSTWMLLSAAMGAGLLGMAVVAWRARQHRLAEAARLAAERRKQRF